MTLNGFYLSHTNKPTHGCHTQDRSVWETPKTHVSQQKYVHVHIAQNTSNLTLKTTKQVKEAGGQNMI